MRNRVVKVKITKLKCLRCGKVWRPTKEDVRQCPYCKTAYWDLPKEENNNKKA